MRCYLKSPDGSCILLFNGSGDNWTTNSITSNYIFKNSGDNCLSTSIRYPREYNFQDINTVPYFSPANAENLRDAFSNVGADGTWYLIFGNSSGASQNRHNFVSASLVFGSAPPADFEDNTSESGLCANGIDAIIWDGLPSCYNNSAGKTPSDQTADEFIYPSNNIGGCNWNSENNYTSYIKFTPTKTPVTLTVQGDEGKFIQSIVVKPNNTSLDPCTSSSNFNWSVVSCPRDDIYSTNVGTDRDHTHTFDVNIGEDYYLVVDGSGSTNNTNFSLSGDILSPLPVNFIDFTAKCKDNLYVFEWSTASETNNDYFTIQHSENGVDWEELSVFEGNGTISNKSTYKHEVRAQFKNEINYFRLIQTDFNGDREVLKTISSVGCNMEYMDFQVVPNPNNGNFSILFDNTDNIEKVQIKDLLSRVLYSNNLVTGSLAVNLDESAGMYLVVVDYVNGDKKMKKIILE